MVEYVVKPDIISSSCQLSRLAEVPHTLLSKHYRQSIMPGIKSKMDSAVPDQTDSSGDRQDESTNRKQDTEAQNPLKAKSQRLTTKKRPGPYSCVKVLPKSQVIDDPYVNGAGSGSGSLTLCYENNIKHTIPYNYSIRECQTIDIPLQFQEMAFERLELAHGEFVLYSRKNGSGRAKTVESISGYREYSAEDIGFSVVKSVKILGKVSFAPVKVHKGRLYFSVIIRHRD